MWSFANDAFLSLFLSDRVKMIFFFALLFVSVVLESKTAGHKRLGEYEVLLGKSVREPISTSVGSYLLTSPR